MKSVFTTYLTEKGFDKFDLRAVLFDMDGVLYDSMPHHEKSWNQTMMEYCLECNEDEFYLHEGRVGRDTIDMLIQRNLGRKATEQEKTAIYQRKSELFTEYNNGETIPYIHEVLNTVKASGLIPVLVTGSGQKSLLDNLNRNFPGIFHKNKIVTAYDVSNGKPHPEPYLTGLKKAGNLLPNQAIVIENAPLGVEAATAAGIFTIAVNTGPLPDKVLWDAGANLVLPGMKVLLQNWNSYCKQMGCTN